MSNIQFIDDKSVLNLEIAAGCGNFGKIYYNACYLTDNEPTLKTSCSSCSIDWFCDAHKLPWNENRFDNVILCNAYGFGFNEVDNGISLLRELSRVCKNNSKITIISHHTNKFCCMPRVKRSLERFIDPNISLSLHQELSIESNIDYPNYKFKTLDGLTTIPNSKLIINVIK